MKKNVGNSDKVIRIVLGIVIAVIGIVTQSWWGLLAIVPIGTALINFCPAYALLGLSTQKNAEKSKA